MSKNLDKKSFILYSDLIYTIDKLPDEKAGLLFKHILYYVNNQNQKLDDLLIEIAFEPIKQQLNRDFITWDEKKQKRSECGKLGGQTRVENSKQNQAMLETVKQTQAMLENSKQTQAKPSIAKNIQANQAVTVSENGTVSENVTVYVNKNNSINSRKLKFSEALNPFIEIYGIEMINDFYSYWTEDNKTLTKFKQELEKTWTLERRLESWAKNELKFKNNGNIKTNNNLKSTIRETPDEKFERNLKRILGAN
jgi:hypothetical protein